MKHGGIALIALLMLLVAAPVRATPLYYTFVGTIVTAMGGGPEWHDWRMTADGSEMSVTYYLDLAPLAATVDLGAYAEAPAYLVGEESLPRDSGVAVLESGTATIQRNYSTGQVAASGGIYTVSDYGMTRFGYTGVIGDSLPRTDYNWEIGTVLAGWSQSLTDGRYIEFRCSLTEISALPPVPVPEPTSLLLLGAGLVGLAAVRKRGVPITSSRRNYPRQ